MGIKDKIFSALKNGAIGLGAGIIKNTIAPKSQIISSAKYIQGYYKQTAFGAISDGILGKNLNGALDIENPVDQYDPYHLSDSKKEDGWFDTNGGKRDGKSIQREIDVDTNSFKRGLYPQFDFKSGDYYYEDPLIPSFELYFILDSPLFTPDDSVNGASSFIKKYSEIDKNNYDTRLTYLGEFQSTFFKIFDTQSKDGDRTIQENSTNKSYYVTKISGLENLNHKMIKYGEDKITVTLNEDVSMIAWYLTELYNNLIYSYKDQRYMLPDNVTRFDMVIKINDMRNFTLPQNNGKSTVSVPLITNTLQNKEIKNNLSSKSRILYTLRDCNFDFSESRNYNNDIEIGGYGAGGNITPSTLSFDIYFKSVTRSSTFPLMQTGKIGDNMSNNIHPYKIQPWNEKVDPDGTIDNFFGTLDRINNNSATEDKGYLNNLLKKGKQTILNTGLNYLDNLQTKARESRGEVVNELLDQFQDITTIKQIEPDNIYNSDFNDRTSPKNFGKKLGSDLINDLKTETRNIFNF